VLNAATLSVRPDTEPVLLGNVQNRSDLVDQAIFSVEGIDGWAYVEPSEVGLSPRQVAEVRVTFRPPRSSRVRAGPAQFLLRASSSVDPTVSGTAEGSVEVEPFV
jgi:hypothetical protein